MLFSTGWATSDVSDGSADPAVESAEYLTPPLEKGRAAVADSYN